MARPVSSFRRFLISFLSRQHHRLLPRTLGCNCVRHVTFHRTVIEHLEKRTLLDADLAITMNDAPEPVETGGQVTWTIDVTNNGPSDALNVVVSDPLPPGLTLVGTIGCAEDSAGMPTCTIGTINAGNTVNLTFVANVSTGITQFTNTATV